MEGTGPRTYRSCDRKRLCDYRKLKGFEESSHPRVEQGFDNGFSVDRGVIDDTEEAYGYNTTGYEFAEYYRFIGEPKIGALMTVGVDYAAEELRRPEWDFERTQTRMQGALHCDFRLHKGISR